MQRYDWTINGRSYPKDEPCSASRAARAVDLQQRKGHVSPDAPARTHFAVARPDWAGPRKDTVIVLPGQNVVVDFDTDNPGQWFTHCHNEYHLAAGMATVVSYRT